MRLPHLLLAATAAAALAAAPIATAAGADAPSTSASTTAVVVVAPVTASGHAVAGFTVKNQPSDTIDCSSADPSPGAVAANIEECSPSAAYAIACWKSSSAHHALCLLNPTSHKLVRAHLMGKFAKTAEAKPSSRAPLLIVLNDGTRCSIRDGGAWGTLASHPKWTGSYSCSKHGVVWAAPHAQHWGVNESKARWTVHTGSASGTGTLTVRGIRRAYFVSTSTS